LRMKVFPQAIAIGNIHIGTITGKLNGVMPAQTPTGWRTVCVSTCVPAFSAYSPFRRCGMPQANSTTSIPRCTEPIASGSVLPCSSVTIAASAFWFFFKRLRNSCITRALRNGGVSRQAGSAAPADFTAEVSRLRATYTFNSRSYLRLVAQNRRTNQNRARFEDQMLDQHSGELSSQLLFAYKLNWQTVLFVGAGDLHEVTAEEGDLFKSARQVFMKLSYAFQR